MPLITDTKPTSLIQARPETAPVVPVQVITVTEPDFSPTFVDLTWQPRTNLLTHVEGASWVVTYYSQILTKDSALSGLQLSSSGVYQSYNQIKELELRVSNTLSTTQDDQTKAMKVSGSSIIAPCLIPNEGDMFIADIGEGKTAVFRVTSTVKKSIFKESCYEIGYELDTDTQDKQVALKARSVTTYYYHKNFLTLGKNPLITSEGWDALSKLAGQYRIVIADYFKRFYSKEYATLMMGGQAVPTYDHFLTSYILNAFSQDDCVQLVHVKRLSGGEDEGLNSISLWDAVLHRDETALNRGFTQAGLMSTQMFSLDAQLQPLKYSGFNQVVYPLDPVLGVDGQMTTSSKLLSDGNITGTLADVVIPWTGSNVTLGQNLRGVNLSTLVNQTGPVIYPVTQDAHYVLSNNFYSRTLTMSALETLVLNYIQGKPVDTMQLRDFSLLYTTWPMLEQYYYVPLILTLMKASLQGL